MGRGLSDLQRYILHEAGKRRRVYYVEIMAGFFGFPTIQPLRRWGDEWFKERFKGEDEKHPERRGELVLPGSHYFSPAGIGIRRYRPAKVSLTRHCLRLQQRGLVQCLQGQAHWSGVGIGDQGRQWLSANSVVNLSQS